MLQALSRLWSFARLPCYLINSHSSFKFLLRNGSFRRVFPDSSPLLPSTAIHSRCPVAHPLTFKALIIHLTSFFSNRVEALEGMTCVPTEHTISPACKTVSGRWWVFIGAFAKWMNEKHINWWIMSQKISLKFENKNQLLAITKS